MAKKSLIHLVDDIDGGRADETVRFSLDGRNYEIDLSAKHAAALRDLLAPYIAAGRRVVRAPHKRRAAIPSPRGRMAG